MAGTADHDSGRFCAGRPYEHQRPCAGAAARRPSGQPVVIENKAGGTGTVAIASMLAAKPDGYTLCATPTSVLIRVSQMQKVPFKPFSSCRLVLGYAAPQLGVIVKSTAPWKTLADLVKDAKARPGGLKFATIGVGSTPQAAVDAIASAQNLKLIHVPFKGSAEVIAAVLGGHVDFASMTSEFVPAVRSGQIRLLATMTEKRVAAFPDVPTLREQGYDFVNDTVFVIAAPAGTPPEVLSRLEGALARAVKSREYLEAIDKLDMIPIQYGSGEMDAFQKKQWKIINRHLVGSGVIK
ncbi:MAG TPA: tripartite tricarboxylate transporter substrate binding protein [Smithellaceae bacterium]|nr:tripartite tricarboxylate transporter substrate binding protein [Smithellaceae bacterium]